MSSEGLFFRGGAASHDTMGKKAASARAVSEYVGAQLKNVLSTSGTAEAEAFVTEHMSAESGIFANGVWLM